MTDQPHRAVYGHTKSGQLKVPADDLRWSFTRETLDLA